VLINNDGFEERIQYVEDQELSFRLASRGYKMKFQPEAVVYHLHSANIWDYFRKKFMIAYWKAQIVRRFPARGVKDSHTPQILKFQMVLISLILGALIGVFINPYFAAIAGILSMVFNVTSIPFMRKAWEKDKSIAAISPILLVIRALALSLGYIWGIIFPISGFSNEKSTVGGANYILKRTIDIAGSLLGIIFLILISPIIIPAIILSSSGPIFFKQKRIGQDGKPFTIYKFRSMKTDLTLELNYNDSLNVGNQSIIKPENDLRITTVGRFLRRWSLDEIPQFWNILKGDMSLVGPRPEEERIVKTYNSWHRRRLAVKPGLTGPMQINGRADLTLDERVKLEIEYINNYTIWRDIVIISKTIPAVLKGKGAR
jgi:lipopolysaccharide/colanic/teichoic acid biosynthesis glycosyltransferase